MKLLLAEDDPVTSTLLRSKLGDWGYNIVTTGTGTDVWNMLQHPNGPRLAILDWQMPGLSGIEICQRLRARQGGTYVYVILLTSLTQKAQVVQGLKAGADDYLTKPCDPDELKVRLQTGERVLNLETELLETVRSLKKQLFAPQGNHYSDQLTGREMDILRLSASGKTPEDIAQHFHLSLDWVYAHFNNIQFKMDVASPSEAVRRAVLDRVVKTATEPVSVPFM